jgi:hypothetical protein
VVFLPEHDYEVVAAWLDLLYQGTLDLPLKQNVDATYVQKYFKFADLVGSEKLKNEVMDALQKRSLWSWSLDWITALERAGLSSSPAMDYVFECLAYRIIVGGWVHFTSTHRLGTGEKIWYEYMSEPRNHQNVARLYSMLDQLNNEKDRKALICPQTRKDCSWHEHMTEEARAKCHRNGEQTMRKDNGGTIWTRGPLEETLETSSSTTSPIVEAQDTSDGTHSSVTHGNAGDSFELVNDSEDADEA